MIYKILKQLIHKHAQENETPILSQIDAEHLIVNEILKKPYFDSFPKLDLYMNEFDHVTFYNGSCSVDTISKDEFSSTGGYAMNQDEYNRLERIQDVLSEASSLNDLVNKFDDEDGILIQKFSAALPKDDYYGFLSMVKFKENFNNNPNFEIDYQVRYANSMLMVGINHACSLDRELSFSTSIDNMLREHLLNNKGTINQDTIYIGTLKNIINAENLTLKNIFNKKLIQNPNQDSNHSHEQKTIYSNLSAIFNNPLIRDNTVVGIIFDDTISGQEKLVKIYEKKYFNAMKRQFINMIDSQLSRPTIEDLTQRYKEIIEPITEQIERQFPILNTVRESNIYNKKSDYDFSIFCDSIRNKDNILTRDLFTAERSLLNGGMDGYFTRILEPVNIKLVERLSSDSITMKQVDIINYHNDIESVLLLKMKIFADLDLPKKEKPNIMVLEQISFPESLTNNAFDILNNYIKEQHKLGKHIVINTKDFNSFNERYREKLMDLNNHPNITVCAFDSFELKFSKIMETLDFYDIREKELNSFEKTHMVVSALNKMNTDFKEAVSYYSLGSDRIREFMIPIINEELNNGLTYIKNTQKATI